MLAIWLNIERGNTASRRCSARFASIEGNDVIALHYDHNAAFCRTFRLHFSCFAPSSSGRVRGALPAVAKTKSAPHNAPGAGREAFITRPLRARTCKRAARRAVRRVCWYSAARGNAPRNVSPRAMCAHRVARYLLAFARALAERTAQAGHASSFLEGRAKRETQYRGTPATTAMHQKRVITRRQFEC